MASFTDELINFNPYQAQIPVDDYVRVGMIKQDQYNQGVQKVQGYINSIAGLEVVKPEQQEYLQQRVNQLQGEVGKVISQDFSKSQLTNSIGNLTSKMASDPIIATAVKSTQNYKNGLAAMKLARDKGESSPSNEYAFQNQFQKWVSDKDVATSFSGEYVPYRDVNKKIAGLLKEIDPNSSIQDIPYKRGANGQVLVDKDGQPEIDFAMIQKTVKGVTPERIRAVIQANLDPNDMRQLQIDGMYNYRGADKGGMKQVADASYNYRLEQVNDTIKGLLVKRQTNISDPNFVADVDAQINSLKDRATELQNRYKSDISSLDADPEAFKGATYLENYLSKFSDGYAYSEHSLNYKENPYFTAAERRRENDIKFEEFMVNANFKAKELAINEAKLEIERSKEKREKKASGKKSGEEGDGAPLPLAGSFVGEPINQDVLKGINSSTFINETKAASDQLDNTRMALLAQVRPDLVTVVRDSNGSKPRYEYNVANKNPNEVKSEAQATVLALKEAYDKGQDVEDGVKSYFDNLGSTQQKIDNRKSAITQIQSEADAIHNIGPAVSSIKPITFTSGSGTRYTLDGSKIMNFNEKMKSLTSMSTAGVAGDLPVIQYDDKKAEQILNTPEEKFLYSLMKKRNPTDSDKTILKKLTEVQTRVNVPNQKVINRKNEYIDNTTREIVGANQPGSFQIEAFKAEDRNRARSVLNDILASTKRAGKSNEGVNFDTDDVEKLLNKTNEANTTYSLVALGADKYAIRLNNTDISGEGVDVSITKPQAQQLFGAGQFLDDFQAIREALQLTKSRGKVTTDVQNNGRESAFSVRNGQLENYGVKYHVEDPLKNGGLQVRLYIFDKEEDKWKETTASFGTTLNEAQVTKLISKIDDTYIDALLKKTKE